MSSSRQHCFLPVLERDTNSERLSSNDVSPCLVMHVLPPCMALCCFHVQTTRHTFPAPHCFVESYSQHNYSFVFWCRNCNVKLRVDSVASSRWYGFVTQMHSFHTSKYSWADGVEEGLKWMRRRNWHAVVRDMKERRRVLVGAKVLYNAWRIEEEINVG